MWIIADYLGLSGASLSESPLRIAGMRLLTESLESYSPELVYVGAASDIFSDKSLVESCVLLNGKNIVIVPGKNTEELSNDLFACFEYYAQWEQSLEMATRERNALQAFIDVSENVFCGPMTIIDHDGFMLAHSKIDNKSPAWFKELVAEKFVPPNIFPATVFTADGRILPDWNEIPEIYIKEGEPRRIGVHIKAPDSSKLAFCVRENKKIFAKAHCQLAEILCRFITRLATEREYKPLSGFDMFFTDLLDGKYHDENGMVVKPLPHIEMGLSAPWVLMVAPGAPFQGSVVRQKRLLSEIKTFPFSKRAIIFNNNIVIAIDRDYEGQAQKGIGEHAGQYSSIGISTPFSKMEDAYSRYHQCMIAISTGKKPVVHAAEIAFAWLLGKTTRVNAKPLFRHPALEILREKDSNSATELYETLQQYLLHERNNNETAKALEIHRNTLSYRLLQIEELTALHLDNAEERHFALLSFLLEKER
ncbi:MAG: helix-turn-helix domain-containing protein [Treponema sp.]|nr:helix-turn-helix domain-containing protein [Treponema sp.]